MSDRDDDDHDHDPDEPDEERVHSRYKPGKSLTSEQKQRQLIRTQHLKQETVKIIESLLEGKTDADHLRKCVSLLSKSDYDDLNTERSLASVCGYPLCDHILGDAQRSTQQKFKIDFKKRKIFRMEERMLFCSVKCLESSVFLKEQLSDEALWLRYKENEGYDGLYRQGSGIRFSDEAQIGREQEQPVTTELKKNFSSRESVSFPYIKQDHIKELQKSINSLTIKDRDSITSSSSPAAAAAATTTKDSNPDDDKEESDMHVNRSRDEKDPVTGSWIVSADSRAHPAAPGHLSQPPDETPDARERVTCILREWITDATLRYILGNEFDKQYLRIKDDQVKESLAHEESRKRKLEESIEKIIQRLDRQDLLEDLLQPLHIQPDLGEKYIPAASDITPQQEQQTNRKSGFQPRRRSTGSRKKVSFKDVEGNYSDSNPVSGTECQTPDPEPKLPITSNSPAAFRRQIVFDQLNQALMSHFPDHMACVVLSLIKPLFLHFHLTASNVVMKNEEWTLATLFLLRFLEVRSRIKKQQAIASDSGVDTATRYHDELLALLNNETIRKVDQFFYDRPRDWEEKVNLFLYQTGDV